MAKPNPTPASKNPPQAALDRRTLVEQYMPYVRSIAGKIKKTLPAQVEYEDLVEYGMIGLVEAADRYDPKHGANFITFAYYRIRGAIYDGLRGMGWLSRSEYARARFEERSNQYLGELASGNAEHTDQEALNRPEDATTHNMGPLEHAIYDLATTVQGLAAIYITSLDAAEDLQLADTKQVGADEKLGLEQSRALIRKTIKQLNDDERQLLEMYYYRDMSLQQIGEKMNLSKSWVSRLHTRVIDKLHRLLEEALAPPKPATPSAKPTKGP